MSKQPTPPKAMFQNQRELCSHFHDDEYLFRRVPTSLWDLPEEELGIEAIELPDMSVGRSKFGHPEWLRFDNENRRFFKQWGIIGFKVCDVPAMTDENGGEHFTFAPRHVPLEMDYPHSEVCAFKAGVHAKTVEDISESVHLIWRELLLRVVNPIVKPRQNVKIRDFPPTSHILEPVEFI